MLQANDGIHNAGRGLAIKCSGELPTEVLQVDDRVDDNFGDPGHRVWRWSPYRGALGQQRRINAVGGHCQKVWR